MAKTRLYALALWLLGAFPAAAQGIICPQMTEGWALQWPGPLTAAVYQRDLQILYIVFHYTQVSAYSHVPVGVMTSLSYTQNPVPIYNNYIKQNYPQLTLDPITHCPESGPTPPPPTQCSNSLDFSQQCNSQFNPGLL